MAVGQHLSGLPILGDLAAPGVAQPAGLDLFAQLRRRHAALRRIGALLHSPAHAIALVELHHKTIIGAACSSRLPRPADMARACAMAGFTAHADLGKGGRELIAGRIVVLTHAGRVTFGAHEIPVLVEFGPVQRIAAGDLAIGIEMKPALATLIFGPAVPRDRQRLNSAIGKGDQILLQRLDAKSVFDLKHAELAVRPIGLDPELAVLAEESRARSGIVESGVVKVAAHRLLGGVIHGVAVLGAAPQLGLLRMTAATAFAADELRGLGGLRGRRLICSGWSGERAGHLH